MSLSVSYSYIHCNYFRIKRRLLKINYTVESFAFDQNVKKYHNQLSSERNVLLCGCNYGNDIYLCIAMRSYSL